MGHLTKVFLVVAWLLSDSSTGELGYLWNGILKAGVFEKERMATGKETLREERRRGFAVPTL